MPKKSNFNATLSQFHGVSKKTGDPFDAFELRAGHFTTLIFPRSDIEREYLKNYIDNAAREAFQNGDEYDEPFTD